jgi:hypothetical protein
VSREVRRVEPLPSPFVLPGDAARSSRLYSRMVFLALTDEAAARDLLEGLRAREEVRTTPGPSRLFELGLLHPWGAFHLDSDVGLGGLLTAREFLTLLRGLADDLLAPALQTGTVLVDWSPQHADPRSVAAIRSVYPDAVVVTEPTTADDVLDRLPAGLTAATPPENVAPNDVMRDRLIVIIGAGRSGTTWLEELLIAYDDIGGVPGHETWLFHSLRMLWRNHAQPDGVGAWVDQGTLVRALRTYCDGVLAAARQRHAPHAHFYVEKTPVHAERLLQIATLYPDAWVVHLLRDGRDVARSMSQVPFFDVPNVADAAALWARVVGAVRRDAPRVPRFREVRYESLHADPAAVLHELRDWMHAAPASDPAVLADAITRRVSAHAGTARPVGPDSGRSLSSTDLTAIYAAAGNELVRTGYVSRTQVWRVRLRPAALFGQRSRKSRTAEEKASGSSTQGK